MGVEDSTLVLICKDPFGDTRLKGVVTDGEGGSKSVAPLMRFRGRGLSFKTSFNGGTLSPAASPSLLYPPATLPLLLLVCADTAECNLNGATDGVGVGTVSITVTDPWRFKDGPRDNSTVGAAALLTDFVPAGVALLTREKGGGGE